MYLCKLIDIKSHEKYYFTCKSEESLSEDRLGQHAVLDLIKTDGLVISPPVPPGDVEEVALNIEH